MEHIKYNTCLKEAVYDKTRGASFNKHCTKTDYDGTNIAPKKAWSWHVCFMRFCLFC